MHAEVSQCILNRLGLRFVHCRSNELPVYFRWSRGEIVATLILRDQKTSGTSRPEEAPLREIESLKDR